MHLKVLVGFAETVMVKTAVPRPSLKRCEEGIGPGSTQSDTVLPSVLVPWFSACGWQ